MLGIQPPRSAEESLRPYPDMTRNVAAATTEMMWAVALATTRASFASTAQGLALWSRMLRVPIGPWSLITSSLIAGPFAANSAMALAVSAVSGCPTPPSGPSAADETASTAAPADAPAEEAPAFASYRSSGGHASAQVITHP